jgi:hypothetical protein
MFTSNLSYILGFNQNVYYPPILQTSNYSINSTQTPNSTPINSVIVRCSLVNNNCSTPSDVLDTFYPNVSFGSNIVYNPAYEKWISCNPGIYSDFEIYFSDQNFNQIQAQDPNVLISLLLRDSKKSKRQPNTSSVQFIPKSIKFKDEIFDSEEKNI